jgi:hypothetical protein
MPRSDPSLVWEAAAANERLGPLTGLWFESSGGKKYTITRTYKNNLGFLADI